MSRCCTAQHPRKQMSIRKLPPVLALHIKRFEHSSRKQHGRKLNTPVAFPITDLDVRPYLSSSVLRARYRPPSQPAGQKDPSQYVC